MGVEVVNMLGQLLRRLPGLKALESHDPFISTFPPLSPFPEFHLQSLISEIPCAMSLGDIGEEAFGAAEVESADQKRNDGGDGPHADQVPRHGTGV